MRLAMSWAAAGNPGRAEAVYRDVIRARPGFYPACRRLSSLLESQGDGGRVGTCGSRSAAIAVPRWASPCAWRRRTSERVSSRRRWRRRTKGCATTGRTRSSTLSPRALSKGSAGGTMRSAATAAPSVSPFRRHRSRGRGPTLESLGRPAEAGAIQEDPPWLTPRSGDP